MRLTPKALAVLRVLVARAGQVVSKQELFEAVWPDTVVSDAALSSCIQELRHALHEDARHPRYLETVHRRGFRFAPVSAEELPAAAPGPTFARPPAFVGREGELQELRSWLALAEAGERQVVFVTGESGIGKTTVVDAFLAEVAATGGWRIGHGQCVEHYGAGEAYLPILDALGRLGREAEGERVVQVLTRYAPTWLSQLPALISSAELRAIQRRTQPATRERMLRELTEAVEALAADRPLVLRLEDLHWSDASTLDWLAFLARRPERARLMLIGIYRPVEVLGREHPLAAVKPELQLHRQCRELALGPLDRRAVAAYLARRCPAAPKEAPALARLAGAIHARTEGHPLSAGRSSGSRRCRRRRRGPSASCRCRPRSEVSLRPSVARERPRWSASMRGSARCPDTPRTRRDSFPRSGGSGTSRGAAARWRRRGQSPKSCSRAPSARAIPPCSSKPAMPSGPPCSRSESWRPPTITRLGASPFTTSRPMPHWLRPMATTTRGCAPG